MLSTSDKNVQLALVQYNLLHWKNIISWGIRISKAFTSGILKQMLMIATSFWAACRQGLLLPIDGVTF